MLSASCMMVDVLSLNDVVHSFINAVHGLPFAVLCVKCVSNGSSFYRAKWGVSDS